MEGGPGHLERFAEEACAEIDAGFFSADAFLRPAAIERIEWYMGRWQRQLSNIKDMRQKGEIS